MVAYHASLLEAAQRLVAREAQQSGRLSGARIRRSISTCYYALVHFLLDDASRRLVGNQNKHLARRRIVMRSFTHAGIKFALNKIRGKTVDRSVAGFMRPPGLSLQPMPTPDFARFMASVFIDAQAQRHNSDYDLNIPLSERNAHELQQNCREAINGWQPRKPTSETSRMRSPSSCCSRAN